ncbi:MAG: ATP-binding region, ATPase-like [uncultured Rubrobacteraceae bacterium]|uniref:ATP-binding region, ATPase-like n=1 Tax=uncultured Rubrobacteraceae bacterium TaxID=349277 RepID=A0A6J4QXA4_9ACTN|nr:MAG: ATP-binding region, ATPase-like [uncultured Rubrobacteraceae bacterium]
MAWSLCGLTLSLVACVVAFEALYRVSIAGLFFLLVFVVPSALVGAVVASRQPRNPVGWFLVVSAICWAVNEATGRYAVYGLVIEPGSLPLARLMAWPSTWMWEPAFVLIGLFLPLYFPDGRLLSPRWRPVLWLALLFSVGFGVVFGALDPGELDKRSPGVAGDVPGVVNPLGIEALQPLDRVTQIDIILPVLLIVLVLCSVASLVVRFRRSSGEEPQQMKWLTYAAAAYFATLLLVMSLPADSAWYQAVDSLSTLVLAGLPVAVGIAVLRYRLYDIDIIINRTLVYGSLTVMLVALYFGGIVVLQRVFVLLTGQQSTLAVVASTLLIAALFTPFRHRIQSFIDRRFYRRKYDARKTLEAFSTKLKNETDLEALNNDLVGVVRETMQPAHVSLWLRPDPAQRRVSAD